MNTESIKKVINDKFDEIEYKVYNLTSNSADNKEKIYGYTVKQLLEEIKRLNKELVYSNIAGFFDGEGYIGTHITKKKNSSVISLEIGIGNTNLEILVKMKKIFNGNISAKLVKENRKQWWAWNIDNRDEKKFFLEKMLPYSTVKRQQIEYGLRFLELTTDSRGKGRVSLEEQKIRQYFSDKLKEMKDIEYTNEELKVLENEIKDTKKDKYQPSLADYQ